MLNFFGLCSNFGNHKLKPGEVGVEVYKSQRILKYQNQSQQKLPILNSSPPTQNTFKQLIKNSQKYPVKTIKSNPMVPTQARADEFHKLLTVQKSNFQQIEKNLKQKKQKYTDPQFPPQNVSVGKNKRIPSQVRKWIRLSEFYKNPVFIQDGIKPDDVIQGYSFGSGNCYLMASIANLAQNPQRITKIFGTVEFSKQGIYYVKLFQKGRFRQIIVDDFIPLNLSEKPLFSRPLKQSSEIWVHILQKCYAKLFGSYESMIGGLPSEAYYALTGAPTFFYSISKTTTKQQLAKYWDKIVQSFLKGYCMSCGTPVTLDQKGSINTNHAYSILGAYQFQGLKLLKLRNPLGRFQWNGRASDKDEQFWNNIPSQAKILLGYENKNDGTFFMLWQDFPTYFILFQICQYKDDASILSIRSNFTMKNANMYQLQTTGGEIVVSLVEDSKRGTGIDLKNVKYSKSYFVISKYIPNNKGQISYKITRMGAKNNFAAHHQRLNLQAGKYIIYAKYGWLDQIDKQASFIVYSDATITIRQATQSQYPLFLQKSFMSIVNQIPQFINPAQLGYVKKFYPLSGGFGFYAFKLSQKSKSRFMIQIDEQQLKKIHLTLKKPYKGKGKILIVLKPGQDKIVVFRNKDVIIPTNLQIPDPKITKESS